mmetsp:Transcript_16986/g.58041  ORF Transcript_16986/g.58041 Transcript_16986/m.58041 type:complete len:200 (-) Transcript_16986:942-1541(-)
MVRGGELPGQGHGARAGEPRRQRRAPGRRVRGRPEQAALPRRPRHPAARRGQRGRHPPGHPADHARQRHQGGPQAGDRGPVHRAVAPEAPLQHNRGRRVDLRGVPPLPPHRQLGRLLGPPVGQRGADARRPRGHEGRVAHERHHRPGTAHAAPHRRVPALPLDPAHDTRWGEPGQREGLRPRAVARRPAVGGGRPPRQP